jgi:hypothetical protein
MKSASSVDPLKELSFRAAAEVVVQAEGRRRVQDRVLCAGSDSFFRLLCTFIALAVPAATTLRAEPVLVAAPEVSLSMLLTMAAVTARFSCSSFSFAPFAFTYRLPAQRDSLRVSTAADRSSLSHVVVLACAWERGVRRRRYEGTCA